ncbi:Sec-independent protein translocase protein TatB [Salinispirillum sp. LH 10-3-1]|uniref:Sec-independent protein translocase protein TatB n=1 Tax=Salinispirillum sp. LH 10-3-1 TaxID=2952525 RepID=A0AB38YF37_9GAMM
MFDIGFLELAIIAGIALIVLGPERLPGAARTVGRYIGQARRMVGNFQRQIEQEVRLDELNKKIMEDTKGQTFTNNDGTTTDTSMPAVQREPAGNDPGLHEVSPENVKMPVPESKKDVPAKEAKPRAQDD